MPVTSSGVTQKLDQLTSLRFVAALMIVIHHTDKIFGIPYKDFNLGQGVSLFFILSGFILAYVYPQLENAGRVRQFLRARIARIWPAHFATFILGFFLIPYFWNTPTAVANLLLIQSWIPFSSYYYAYNAVSWSISTEFFFYLAFPLLIWRWNRSWLVKTALSAGLLLLLMVLCNHYNLPEIGTNDGTLPSKHALLYISPLGRLFEFVAGMATATLWLKTKWRVGVWWGTAAEIGAFMICGLALYHAASISSAGGESPLGSSAAFFLGHAGAVFPFALLIYVLAQGSGALSKIMAAPSLVVLGETSYAMYLLHQIFLIVFERRVALTSIFSKVAGFGGFMAILLAASYLMWVCWEMPARRFLLGHRQIHGSDRMKESWRSHRVWSVNTLVAAAVLAGGCLVFMLVSK